MECFYNCNFFCCGSGTVLNFREEELSDNKIQNLPDYVESLSSIMVELDTVSKEQLTSLQYLTVILIENFPKLPPAFHIIATNAISAALCNLVQVGSTVFSDFVTSVGKSAHLLTNISSFSRLDVVDTEAVLLIFSVPRLDSLLLS